MKGIKKQLGKIPKIALSLLMVFTCINITGFKDVNAVELYPEATADVEVVAPNINIEELGEGDLYDIKLDGSEAFCMDHGKSCGSGNVYARTGTVTNPRIRQVLNWYFGEKDNIGYGRDFVYGMAQATIWAIQQGKTDDESLASIYEDILIYYASAGASGHGSVFVDAYYKGDGSDLNGKAILEYSTSGTYYIYSYGSNSHQRLVTREPGTWKDAKWDSVSSQKSYSTTESIKVQVNKTDVDEDTTLQGVCFDFYQDGKKGGSAVTNSSGIAQHTFKTEFSKSASATKEYVSNYNELGPVNQQRLSGYYTSKAAAQAAADKEALEKAKEAALEGSGKEHTYKVVETATRTGYYLNTSNNTYEKKHTGDGTVTFNITNKRQLGTVSITKKDSKTGNGVADAVYGLYARNNVPRPDGHGTLYSKDTLVARFPKTDANGNAKLENLYLGDYYIKEITASPDYIRDPNTYDVTIPYAGANQQVSVAQNKEVNEVWQPGTITITKRDDEADNGRTLENAVFELYARNNIVHPDGHTGVVYKAGQKVGTFPATKNGTTSISGLYLGDYYVKEVTAPNNYVLDASAKNITLSYAGQDAQVSVQTPTYTNHRQEGKITITKHDTETDQTVPNAVYRLYAGDTIYYPDGHGVVKYNKGDLVGTFPKTNTNGQASLEHLYLGKYIIREYTAPDGYLIDTRDYSVTLSYAGQDVAVTTESQKVIDKVQRGTLEFMKEDNELAHNQGVRDESQWEGAITDADGDRDQGDATREGATYGLYARKDIVHKDTKTGVVSYDQTAGSINEIKLTKGTDLVVKDTKATAGALLATAKTDENGEIKFEHLYLGEYYIKEIEPSEGYLLDSTEYDVNINYAGQTVEVTNKNTTVYETVKRQAFEVLKVGHVSGTSQVVPPLEGVEFTVKLESDVQRMGWDKAPTYDILKTNENGYDKSLELPYGLYHVKETKPALDYDTAEDFYVNITEDSRTPQHYSNKIIVEEQFSALIKAVKMDKETGKQVALPDTEFKIKALTDVYVDGKKFEAGEYIGYWNWNILDGFYTDSWKTNDEGYVIINEKLGAGEYQLEEIHAPYGYVLDETPLKFKVTNANMYETSDKDNKTPVIKVNFADVSVKGQITVTKQGEVLTGYKDGQFAYETRGLADMKANVYAKEDIMDPSNDGTILYKAGELVETLTTDSTGKATTKKLPLGKYTVKEVQAPHGYVINKTEYDVELKYKDENTPLVFETVGYENDRQKIDLSLYKKNAEQTTMLAGGEFDIIADQDIQNIDGEVIVTKGTVLDHIITDTNGYATTDLDLPLDTSFAFIETKAPIGYILDETPIPFETTYEGQDYQEINVAKEALNEETKIVVSKLDMTTSEELPDNVMKIFEKDNEGSTFITWISTDKPQEITNLDVNTRYILRETSAAKGFYLAQDIEFELDVYGNLYVANEDGELVKAEENKLTMENDLVKGRLEWNKQGEIFTHTDTGQTEFGKVETPVWEESNLLQAEITIYAAEDITLGNGVTYFKKDEKIQTLESDWDAVQSQDLLVGKYYYVESKVPHGYVVDTDKHYFEVKDNQSSELQIVSSTLENNRPTVEIDFTKFMERFEHHNKVDDAYKDVVFGIYAREDIYDYMGSVAIENGTMVGTSGIDELGHLTNVPDLPNGVYYIKELATNKDYVLDQNEYDFEIAYHGSDVSSYTVVIGNGSVENELIRGSIEIKKNDSFDAEKKLKDVEFNISANADMSDVIATAKTDAEGKALFEDMEIGKYYIQEAKQIDGYTYNDHIYEVEIANDGEVLTINVDNKPTEMEFSKVDETGTKELPGAEVEVIDKETGEIVDKWTSTKEKHIINYLVEGKEYIFRETTAPYGYEIAEEIVFVAGDGKTVTMQDNLILTDIQVNKVDSQTMKAIVSKNFEFTMYSDEACQNVLARVNANTKDGTATFKDVPYGTYYIKETKAPLGYQLSTEVKKVVIDENTEGVGDIHSFIYLNTLMPAKKTETVQTGDNQNATLYAGLLLGAGVAIAGVSFKKKKDKKKEK